MANRNLGTLTIDLIAKIGGFTSGLDQAGRVADKRMRDIEKRAKAAGVLIGAALSAAGYAIADGIRDAINEADKLNDLNQRLGLSAEALSGYSYAAKQSGTDIEALARGMKLLAKNTTEALDAGSEQGKLFDALNIDVIDQATGKLRSLEDLLPEIAEKFRILDDATLESALAQKLFGKSGDELIEFLNLGRQGIEDYREELRAMGGEMSGDTLAKADALKDKLSKIDTQFDAIYLQLAERLLPALQDFADYTSEAAENGSGFISIIDGMGPVLKLVGGYLGKIADLARLVGLNFGFLTESLTTAAGGIRAVAQGDLKAALLQMVRLRDLAKDYKSQFSDLVYGSDPTSSSSGASGKKRGGRGAMVDPSSAQALAESKALHNAVTGVLDGDPAKSKKTGKSDAEKEAERLLEMFQRLREQQAQSIALYGQTTEVAKLRYQLEHGDLAKLTDEQKSLLLGQAEMLDNLDALAKRREEQIELEQKENDAIREHKELVSGLLEDIAFETELLGKNNKEKEIAVALRRLGARATDEEKAAITSGLENLQSLSEQVGVLDEFRESFQDNVADVLSGTKSITDAVDDMAKSITQILSRRLAEQFSDWLLGAEGTSNTGWLGSLFGSLFSGSGSSGITSSGAGGITGTVPGFAGGTNFAPGGLAIVGEEGPELMNVPRGAQIMPADQTARMLGGPQIVQHINVLPGASRETGEQSARAAGREARTALARTG